MPVTTRQSQSTDAVQSETALIRTRRRNVLSSSSSHIAKSSAQIHLGSADADHSLLSQLTNHVGDQPKFNAQRCADVHDQASSASARVAGKCRGLISWFTKLLPIKHSSTTLANAGYHALIPSKQFSTHFDNWPYPYVLSRECVKVVTEEIIDDNCVNSVFTRYSSLSSKFHLLYMLPLMLASCLLIGLLYSPVPRAELHNGFIRYATEFGVFIRRQYHRIFPPIEPNPVSSGRDSYVWEKAKRQANLEEKLSERLERLELHISQLSVELHQVASQSQKASADVYSKHRVELDVLSAQLQQYKDELQAVNQAMGAAKERIEEQNVLLQDHSQKFTLVPPSPCECPSVPALPIQTLDTKDVDQRIRDALRKYDADKTGLADYALESAGSTLLSIRCTETYPHKTRVITLLGIPLFYKSYSPRKVIQPGTMPGECWAFTGSVGSVVIKLSGNIQVTGVSYEHAAKSVLPDNHMDSAPKRFDVYGLLSKNDKNGTLLGSYTFEDNDEPLQYFDVQTNNATVVPIVEFKILNNHGHPQYTCLYRFRVHGRRISPVYGRET